MNLFISFIAKPPISPLPAPGEGKCAPREKNGFSEKIYKDSTIWLPIENGISRYGAFLEPRFIRDASREFGYGHHYPHVFRGAKQTPDLAKRTGYSGFLSKNI
jgi:hypothetical protein